MEQASDDEEKAIKIMRGDVRAASRLIRNLEDKMPEARSTLKHIFHHTGRAHIIGITGSPGTGKSTLADSIINYYRTCGKTVGVLAIDPTSPFTGGAILGDRLRMQRHSGDAGVFVRSMATRGNLGGLSCAVGDAVHVMDAMGKDIVIIETVGTGQQEVEIINHAHTVLVLLVPGSGDDIQAVKAGIMEIADIFVINKADHEESRMIYNIISSMLDLVHDFPGGWRPPIIKIGNFYERIPFMEQIEELCVAMDRHYQFLKKSTLLSDRLKRKTMMEVTGELRSCIFGPILQDLMKTGEIERMADKIMKKEADPYSLAEEVAKKYLKNLSV